MNIEILENKKDKLKIMVDDDTTLVSVLNEYIWRQDPSFSAFAKDHIYLSKPKLIVRAKNPKKAIINASKEFLNDIKSLKQELTRL